MRPFHPLIVRRPDFCGMQPDNLVHGGYVRIRVHADRVLSIYDTVPRSLVNLNPIKTDNSATDSWKFQVGTLYPISKQSRHPYTKWMEVNWAMVNLIRIRFSSGHMIFLPLENSGHCHIEYHILFFLDFEKFSSSRTWISLSLNESEWFWIQWVL